MQELIKKMLEALERGENVVLCHILASSGSTPRGAGARMAVWEDGTICGTIGGGEVERQAILQAKEIHKTGNPLVRGYVCRPDDIRDLGMICGGDVTVHFSFFPATDTEKRTLLTELLPLLDENRNVWMVKEVTDGMVTDIAVYDERNGLRFSHHLRLDTILPLLQDKAVYVSGNPTLYAEPLQKAGLVYLFGGGHVGKELVPVLEHIGFRVIVFDNRPALAKQENYPKAYRVICGDYRMITDRVSLTENDYAVIMTPGHESDREILAQVLKTDATYIGCIGSRTKIRKTNERLREEGFTEKDILRIHSPIGLPIGGSTPEEIAISIAAELIQHRSTRRS